MRSPIHSRSLDMFDRMGIVDELVATGVKSTGMYLFAGRILTAKVNKAKIATIVAMIHLWNR